MKKLTALILGVTVCAIGFIALSACSDYTYEVNKRGSHVEQIDEEFECAAVEKYPDFKSFKKSSISKVYNVADKTYSETKYTKEFFKNADLVVLKFEYDEGSEFFVEDMISDGKTRKVIIQGIKMPYETATKNNYVFFETKENVSNLEYTLEIGDVTIATGNSMMYVASDNKHYQFENEIEPSVRVFSDGNQIDKFIENDPVLTQLNYAAIAMKNFEKHLSEYDLLCVKLPSSNVTVTILDYSDGTVKIKTFFSDHYTVDIIPCHQLSILLIPKNSEINMVSLTSLKEYDGAEGNVETKNYTMQKTELSDYREYIAAI